MNKEKMIKAARDIKTACSSLLFEDCCFKKVECPFQKQQLRGDKYVCLLKSFDKFPYDWEIPTTLDGWIRRFEDGNADELSRLEQDEIKKMLIELKERRKCDSDGR